MCSGRCGVNLHFSDDWRRAFHRAHSCLGISSGCARSSLAPLSDAGLSFLVELEDSFACLHESCVKGSIANVLLAVQLPLSLNSVICQKQLLNFNVVQLTFSFVNSAFRGLRNISLLLEHEGSLNCLLNLEALLAYSCLDLPGTDSRSRSILVPLSTLCHRAWCLASTLVCQVLPLSSNVLFILNHMYSEQILELTCQFSHRLGISLWLSLWINMGIINIFTRRSFPINTVKSLIVLLLSTVSLSKVSVAWSEQRIKNIK